MSDDEDENERDTVLYLTTYSCANSNCDPFTIAHEDVWVPLDQSVPVPDVRFCPTCALQVGEHDIIEVREAEVVAQPEKRGSTCDEHDREYRYDVVNDIWFCPVCEFGPQELLREAQEEQ